MSRLAVLLLAYLAAPLIDDHAETLYHLRSPANVVLDVLGSRWDTGFYVSIAELGYQYPQDGSLPSVAFFPMLPVLMRGLMALGLDAVLAGVLLANGALLIASMLFYRLVESEWGESVADRAVWYLLIFPVSFFGSAIYTESIALMSAIGALYCFRREQWVRASVLGAVASASRLLGLLVAPLLLVEWWTRRRGAVGRRPPLRALLVPAAVPLGTLAYMLYLWHAFDDPLAFAHASAVWGRQPSSPLGMLAPLFATPAGGWGSALAAGSLPLDDWIDFLSVAGFLAMGVVLLAQRQWAGGLFVTLGAVAALFSGLLMSQRRYVWLLFPAFVLMARWGARAWVDRLLTVLFLAGLALFTALFANGYWVA